MPVRAVWWGARGQWFPMTRTADNYFSLSSPDGQAFEMPARVAIRSVFNDTVYDTVALSRPQRMFAQDRSTVQEGFAGDVIGLSNPGAFAVGDTIYAGALLGGHARAHLACGGPPGTSCGCP